MVFELAAQVVIVLVIWGLIRARLVRFWVLVPFVVGVVINFALGMQVATLIGYLLLLVTSAWVAVRLACSSHEARLGMSLNCAAEPASASV